MKRKQGLLSGFAVLALAAMFTLAGCDSLTGSDDDDSGFIGFALGGSVSIAGTPMTGEILNANTAALGGTGTVSYQWKAGNVNIGLNSQNYTLATADEGSTITVTVTRAGYIGSVTSAATGPVSAYNPYLLTGTVSISGNPMVGQTLTVNTTSLNGTGMIAYQWRANDKSLGIFAQNYTPVNTDVGKTITVIVARTDTTGNITSAAIGPVIPFDANQLTGTVSITAPLGTWVGQTLTANTSTLGGTGDISYQWKVTGVNISGATSATYKLTPNDAGQAVAVTVTRAGSSGSVTSAAVKAVYPALAGTVSISGTPMVGEQLAIDTSSLAGTGTISCQWRANGVNIGLNSQNYTLTAADVGKTITIIVTMDGYSGSVTSLPTAVIPSPGTGGPDTPGIGVPGTEVIDENLVATWHSTQAAADSGTSVTVEFTFDGKMILAGQSPETVIMVTTTSGGRISATATMMGVTVDFGSAAYVVEGTTLVFDNFSGGSPVNYFYNLMDALTTISSALGGDGKFHKAGGDGPGISIPGGGH
jgi:hypothetical protein